VVLIPSCQAQVGDLVSVSLASLDRPRQLPNTAPISPWLRTRHLQPVASGSIFGPRSLRGLITGAPVRAEIGFSVFPTHLAGLAAICDSPLDWPLGPSPDWRRATCGGPLGAFQVCTALFLAEATNACRMAARTVPWRCRASKIATPSSPQTTASPSRVNDCALIFHAAPAIAGYRPVQS
jgi:hypothetical protein